MVNIIIPVYNGVELLDIPLKSLLKQKQSKDDFIVSIVQDYDELDYTDIIDKYKNKGLNIDFIKAPERIKQGRARQMGIDAHPEVEYVMFLDQDDKFVPETIELLYNKIINTKADVVFSNFIKETEEDSETVNQGHSDIITQLHGKIFANEYLNRCDIKFSEVLNYAEDAYFNLMAFHCTNKIAYVDRVTYIWNYNKDSESNANQEEYFKNMYSDYIQGQIEALLHIHKYNEKVDNKFICSLLVYFYSIAMIEKEMGYTNKKYEPYLQSLGEEQFIKDVLKDNDSLLFMASQVRGGTVFRDKPLFFNVPFMDWVDEWLDN